MVRALYGRSAPTCSVLSAGHRGLCAYGKHYGDRVTTGAGTGPWAPVGTDETLRRPPAPGSAGNRPPGEDLELRIGWDRFEKLVLDIGKRVFGLRGTQFRRYGTQGQSQQGIDLAGRHPEGTYVVIQCKDYKNFTRAILRGAVNTFVKGSLPFEAKHLVVATSAPTEETQFVDELEALQKA